MKEPEYYDADRWGIFSDRYEELQQLKEQLEEEEKEKEKETKKEKNKQNNARFNLHKSKDVLDDYSSEMPFLWGNILPKRGLVCLAGESDCGKSALLRQIAIEYCTNTSGLVLGQRFHNSWCEKRALYISTEDERQAFGSVMGKQCKELNLGHYHLNNLYVVFENDMIIEKIENLQKDMHVGLIVIDCLNDVLPTQSTSAVAVRKFLSRLQHISEQHQCLIILSHHTRKHARNRKPSKYNLIGSPAIEAKCRTVIELRTDPFQRNLKHLCIVKGNYIDDKEKDKSYLFEFTPQLTFKETGRRVDIDTLTLMPDYIRDRVEKYNRLRNEGLKGDELANAMGFASRGSLSVWVKKHIKNKPEQPKQQPEKQQPEQTELPQPQTEQLLSEQLQPEQLQQQTDQLQPDQQQHNPSSTDEPCAHPFKDGVITPDSPP